MRSWRLGSPCSCRATTTAPRSRRPSHSIVEDEEVEIVADRRRLARPAHDRRPRRPRRRRRSSAHPPGQQRSGRCAARRHGCRHRSLRLHPQQRRPRRAARPGGAGRCARRRPRRRLRLRLDPLLRRCRLRRAPARLESVDPPLLQSLGDLLAVPARCAGRCGRRARRHGVRGLGPAARARRAGSPRRARAAGRAPLPPARRRSPQPRRSERPAPAVRGVCARGTRRSSHASRSCAAATGCRCGRGSPTASSCARACCCRPVSCRASWRLKLRARQALGR